MVLFDSVDGFETSRSKALARDGRGRAVKRGGASADHPGGPAAPSRSAPASASSSAARMRSASAPTRGLRSSV
ncbi:hypothetical protein BE20_03750 [Sorangium cellulosum]|nr:hypothetical protein BE20_03750 [Sorangium cellulosum]